MKPILLKKKLGLAPATSNSKVNSWALAQHKSNSGSFLFDRGVVCCEGEKRQVGATLGATFAFTKGNDAKILKT